MMLRPRPLAMVVICSGWLVAAPLQAQSLGNDDSKATGLGPAAEEPAGDSDTNAAVPGDEEAQPLAGEDAEPPLAEVEAALTPADGVRVGALSTLTIKATAGEQDDITLPEQSFAPLELYESQRRKGPAQGGLRTFVFELQLQAFEAGTTTLDKLRLRVVTATGEVREQRIPAIDIEVGSLIGNEPNAELKAETKPVVVLEDDYTLVYIGAFLLAALAIAGLTLMIQRYLSKRVTPEPPPPPPRPPWDIAVEQLAALRKRKQAMVEGGQAVQFVDEVSDVVRAYLGGCFGFPGLDTTTAELLEYLRVGRVASGLQDEARAYLQRCDLVKFAKVQPDQDEVDLIFAKAQDIVQFSMPNHRHTEKLASVSPLRPSQPERRP